MCYQGILDALKSKREVSIRDSYGPDAVAARRFFAGDLGQADAQGAFTYRKKNIKRVYQRDKDVALRWRRLLETDETIRARWQAMQDEGAMSDVD
jgi:hypothetical protein